MKRTQAAVLTYPPHFLLTQLTVRSLRRFFPSISRITVIADDRSPTAWSGYQTDCREQFGADCDVVFQSSFSWLDPVDIGWVRQQMVKLHLDWIVEFDEIFVADGDVVFNCEIPAGVTPFNWVNPSEIDQQQRAYVSGILGLDPGALIVNGKPANVNNAGFRDIRREWLIDLRNRLQQKHSKDLLAYHLAVNDVAGISEWELLESFKRLVLDIEPQLDTFYCLDISQDARIDDNTPSFSTCWCCDRDIPREWWRQQGIDVDNFWDQLPLAKNL